MRLFNIDFEKPSRYMNDIPLYVMMAVIFFVFFLPHEIAQFVLVAGIALTITLMVASNVFTAVESAKYIAIKAHIRPWNMDTTFFCNIPQGGIRSPFNPTRRTYITRFKCRKIRLPNFGDVEEFEVESREEFFKLCQGSDGYVVFNGVEVKHKNVILCELWLSKFPSKIDFLQVIPRFWLRSGTQEYWVENGEETIR